MKKCSSPSKYLELFHPTDVMFFYPLRVVGLLKENTFSEEGGKSKSAAVCGLEMQVF